MADQLETVVDPPQRLAVAEQQPSAGDQRGVHRVDDVEHLAALEVDQHVAAQHEIEPGRRRRIGGEVVLAELDEAAQLGADPPAVAVTLEVAQQVLVVEQADGAASVPAFASRGKRGGVDVGADDAHVPASPRRPAAASPAAARRCRAPRRWSSRRTRCGCGGRRGRAVTAARVRRARGSAGGCGRSTSRRWSAPR